MHSYYESTLFKIIFVTIFPGLFKIRDLVHNTIHDVGHAIQAKSVSYLSHTYHSTKPPLYGWNIADTSKTLSNQSQQYC